jgi:cobalt-zinc-cadmium efflux system outer membrane protein
MKFVTLYFCTYLFMQLALSQPAFDSLLSQIRVNNKEIKANAAYWSAQRAEYRTGLTLYDPQVEFDYLSGRPAEAGNQRDFAITQRLDFPTVYGRRKKLSDQQILRAEFQEKAFTQEILLEAKLLLLEWVYLNKRDAALAERARKTQELRDNFEQKLNRGDAIILDVNKARLQLLNIQNESALNRSAIRTVETKLTLLNGGLPVQMNDTLYPAAEPIPEFEFLDSVIEANDPLIKVYDSETGISARQVALQKSLNLPKLEAGYHSQAILGQSYTGGHAGITVPLWENRNRLKAAKLNERFAAENVVRHRLEHRMENREKYDLLSVRRKAMQDFLNVFQSLNTDYLLNKALQLGQITVIQYFQEESYYFGAFDRYLELEWEYERAIAELYKFTL